MFHAAMKAAIEDARTLAHMDELSRQVWQGHGSGALSDDEAQTLAERLHGRRRAIREGIRPVGIPAGRDTNRPDTLTDRATAPVQPFGEGLGLVIAQGARPVPLPDLAR